MPSHFEVLPLVDDAVRTRFLLLSSQSQLYQPARSPPICTSQGQTLSGGAGRNVTIVAPPSGSGTSSSPG
jgi:hypothetical protein